MNYRFLTAALKDLSEAAKYYNGKVPGLGVDFYDEVERAINEILA